MKSNHVKPKFLILCFLLSVYFLSCEKKINQINTSSTEESSSSGTTESTESTDSSTSQTTTETTNSNNCTAKGVGDQSIEYYTIPDIVSLGGDPKDRPIQWSSADDPRYTSPGASNIFMTDSRFNIRILAHPSPGQANDYEGATCPKMAVPYTKLQIKVGVRRPGSQAYVETHVFDNISVDGCSEVYEFNVGQSSEPYIIEISEVKWDYSCIDYTQRGFPEVPQCPWDYVWDNWCFKFSLQLSTDYTKDIPH